MGGQHDMANHRDPTVELFPQLLSQQTIIYVMLINTD